MNRKQALGFHLAGVAFAVAILCSERRSVTSAGTPLLRLRKPAAPGGSRTRPVRAATGYAAASRDDGSRPTIRASA